MDGETTRKRRRSCDEEIPLPVSPSDSGGHVLEGSLLPPPPPPPQKKLPPIAIVWKLINNPVHKIYENLNPLEVENLMTSITNSTKENFIFVPSANGTASEYHEREEKFSAFTVWLLGRLFFLLGSDAMSPFHATSIESQTKIVRMLASQRPHMFQPVAQEYLLCLTDLVQCRKPNLEQPASVLLKRFIPGIARLDGEGLDSPLDLSQVFIELRRDDEQCARLQTSVLDILSSVLDALLELMPHVSERVWSIACELLQNSQLSVKTRVLSFSAQMLSRAGFCMHADTRRKFLCCVQLIVERDPYYADSSEEKKKLRQCLMGAVQEIFQAIDQLHGTMSKRDDLLVFTVLCDILQGIKIKDSSDQLLQVAGVLAKKLLGSTNVPVEVNVIMRLVSNLGACKHGIHVIEDSVLSELKSSILNQTKHTPGGVSTTAISPTSEFQTVSAVTAEYPQCRILANDHSATWTKLEQLLTAHVKALPTLLDQPQSHMASSLDVIQCIVQCVTRVHLSVKRVTFNLDGHLMLKQLMTVLLLMDEGWGAEVGQVLKIVGDLLWLPGMESQPTHVVHTAIGLMLTPWLSDSASLAGLHTLNSKYLLTISHRLGHHLSDRDLRLWCLSHWTYPVCRLPTQCTWPYPLLRSCVDSGDSALAAEAVRSTVKLAFANPGDITSIIDSVIQPALDCDDRLVQVALSESMVKLVCLQAGSAECCRALADSHVSMEIQCTECDSQQSAGDTKQFFLDNAVLRVFLRMLTSPFPEVRRNMAAALPRLSNHVSQFRLPGNNLPCRWIPYLKDDDQGVRLCFARVVKYLIFSRRWMEEKKAKAESTREEYIPLSQYDRRELSQSVPLLETLNSTLMTTVRDSLIRREKSLQESLLATLAEIGRVPVDCVLLPTISMLMLIIGYPSSFMTAAATVCVGNIAAAHNCTPRDLYVRYKRELCLHFAEIAVFNHKNVEYNFSGSLRGMARALGLVGSRELISNDTRTILSRLIPRLVEHPSARFLLDDIARVLGISVSELIEDNYPFVYPHLYLYEDARLVESCCALMEELSCVSIAEQKRLSLKVMSNEMILHYHARQDRVLSGLLDLIKEDPHFKTSARKSQTETIADFLYPQFLGILVSFDSKLVTKVVCESVKRLALLTLPGLIRLMGVKYITRFRLKLLATLRSALRLNYSNFPELNCKAWEAFVTNVEITALGPLLSTIFVSLVPLLDQFPTEINSIFSYLVVEHGTQLEAHFSELYFVPYQLAIEQVHSRIQASIKRNCPSGFKASIQEMLKFVTHENIEVRLFGLRRLKVYLQSQQRLQKAICPHDTTAEPEAIELMDALIRGCKDPEVSVRTECGACLGEIGAIDPGVMPWRTAPPTAASFPLHVSDDVFAVQALTQLCKAYQSCRETQNMDSFSLAIQELLKMYGLSDDPKSAKRHLWVAFPTAMQEIMTPLLMSCYKSISPLKKAWPVIIYGSSYSSSMSEWACSWASKLIASIEDEQVQAIFGACVFSFKRDLDTLQFFLPFIVLHAVMGGSEKIARGIIAEFQAIMADDRTTAAVDPGDAALLPIWTPSFSGFPRARSSDTEKHVKVANTVYSLIDFLHRWVGDHRSKHNRIKGTKQSLSEDRAYSSVHGFLQRINPLEIAAGNYETHNYQRALIYLEDYVRDSPTMVQQELCFFAKIYARLDNPDMVAAVMALRTQEPSLEEMILTHEVTGQLQVAAACYERLAVEKGLGPGFLEGMVQCYLGLDQPFTSLKIAEGIVSERPDLATTMHEAEAETFWRMHMFSELDQLLTLPELKRSQSWGVNVGRGMVAMRQGDTDKLKVHLDDARKVLIHSLGVASLEEAAYQQGYHHIVRLHMLNEFEKADALVWEILASKDRVSECRRLTEALLAEWDRRLESMRPSASIVEPVLCMRRTILSLVTELVQDQVPSLVETLNTAMGRCWVRSAQAARKAGYYQQAYNYVLKAEKYCPRSVFVEKAKLYWEKGEQEATFLTLRRGLEKYDDPGSDHCDARIAYFQAKTNQLLNAEAKLLIATYNDETLNVNMDESVKNYKEAVEVCPAWERSLVCLAQYYDRILGTMDEKERDIKGGAYQVFMINLFGKSLRCGSVYLYQSMPRMLSIWLDFGTRLTEEGNRSGRESVIRRKCMNACLVTMTTFIEKFLRSIPTYMFLTAFSQILSRICHPQPIVFQTLKNIIVSILARYPQQALWMTMCVYKSTDGDREKKCKEIFADKRVRGLGSLIPHMNRLAEMLIELTNKKLPEKASLSSVSSLVRALPRLLEQKDFSPIIMPVEQFRNVMLPPQSKTGEELKNHNPLSRSMVYIHRIEDEIVVLASLQKPRKITFRGSDGKSYPIMCKPKDDLRRDFRLMEFNGIVNKYLLLDPNSRKRGLHIRTYSVVPLNEECGIIEWVPNLIGLRLILAKLYKDRSLYMQGHQYKDFVCENTDSIIKKKKVFVEKLLPKHPPVFGEWFRETFTDPCSWYLARTSYTQTTAVMSMVGYIMGLGDRHGENILYDLTNGETLHVDFNCLFNKGETFDWPEKVPFRLTHNMVSAMGPFGVDGTFRRCCEITMGVIRSQKDTLMSVLRPFVYEPCVTYQTRTMTKHKAVPKEDQNNAEIMNEKAVRNLANIESRLKGTISKGKLYSQTLSVEGQVDSLILEATDINNLADMYIGWAPYM